MRTRLIGLGCLSLVVYSGIAWLSQSFIYGQGHRQRPILEFVALYASAFVLYVLAYSSLLQTIRNAPFVKGGRTKCGGILTHGNQEIPPSPPLGKGGTRIFTRYPIIILTFAILFRVILLFSNPIQEDDFYRYLWDGKVVASGLNPYGVPPSTVEERGEGTEEYQKILKSDGAFVEILARVNHPWVPTIYPPLTQGVFGLTALIAPGSLLGLRITFFAFDVGICLLIVKILSCLKLNAAWVLVYAWSPLVVKETMNSAHYDVVPTFFLVLAVLLMLQGRGLWAHASLALAVLGKVYPIILFPLFVFRSYGTSSLPLQKGGTKKFPLRRWITPVGGIFVAAAVVLAGYAPFLQARTGLWQGAVVFAEQWQTNSLVFPLLAALAGNRWLANVAVIFTLGVVIILLLRRLDIKDDRSFLWGSFVILGLLFLLSPVGDPWYFVWITPFLCVFPSPAWILLSGLLGLYYLSFYFMYHKMAETFRWVLWLEYMPFYGMLLWDAYGRREMENGRREA